MLFFISVPAHLTLSSVFHDGLLDFPVAREMYKFVLWFDFLSSLPFVRRAGLFPRTGSLRVDAPCQGQLEREFLLYSRLVFRSSFNEYDNEAIRWCPSSTSPSTGGSMALLALCRQTNQCTLNCSELRKVAREVPLCYGPAR